jgi:hypothetical protein
LQGNANSLDLVRRHEFEEGKFVFAGNANHFLDREIGGKLEWYLALQVLVRRHDEELELELEGTRCISGRSWCAGMNSKNEN